MIPLTCPTCSVTLKPKPELAGKNIRCPNCETLVRVPASDLSPASDDEVVNPWPLRIGVAAAVVVALAVGLAGGFVYGHGRGMADRAHEASEAKSKAEDADQRAKKAAADLEAALADARRVQGNLDTAVRERDEARLALKDRDDKLAARDRADAERVQAAAREKERERDEDERRKTAQAKERAQKEAEKKSAEAAAERVARSKRARDNMLRHIRALPEDEVGNYDSVLVFLMLKMNDKKEGKLTADGVKEVLTWGPGLRAALRKWVDIGGDICIEKIADSPTIAETVADMGRLLDRDLTK